MSDLEDLYAGGAADAAGGEQVGPLLDASASPRGPDMLFDLAGRLGVGPRSHVLDVGCRDGAHLAELARRFGCRGTGVDPFARPGLAAVVRGLAEALPFPDGCFDLVWVRDVLVHVAPLATALAECRRVLRPGGAVLVFQMFATPRLEQAEAASLWASLAVVPDSADRTTFEAAVVAAGLRVEHRDEVGSEWREHGEEQGDRRTSRQLLRAARLLRLPDHYRAVLGEQAYAVELGDCLWGVYQMIGKLSPVVYVLRG